MAKILKTFLLAALFLSVATDLMAQTMMAQTNSSDIKVTNAFFYVPLGTSTRTTAFFTIINNSNTNIRITGVSSRLAKQISLVPQTTLELPARQTLSLKPDGPYLQINGIKSGLSTGDELHLVLKLSNGRSIEVIALAKSAYDQVHGH